MIGNISCCSAPKCIRMTACLRSDVSRPSRTPMRTTNGKRRTARTNQLIAAAERTERCGGISAAFMKVRAVGQLMIRSRSDSLTLVCLQFCFCQNSLPTATQTARFETHRTNRSLSLFPRSSRQTRMLSAAVHSVVHEIVLSADLKQGLRNF